MDDGAAKSTAEQRVYSLLLLFDGSINNLNKILENVLSSIKYRLNTHELNTQVKSQVVDSN